jgi:tetratricopeptide (TPR) repeat protein/rRNA maturation endonuclease Nob1
MPKKTTTKEVKDSSQLAQQLSLDSSIKLKYTYIFDANFFISQKQIKAENSLEMLKAAKNELNLEFYISNYVYKELPFYQESRAVQFKSAVEVADISQGEIEKIKTELSNLGVQTSCQAQDPDQSLVALAKRLIVSKDRKVHIVSDDFKLQENLKLLHFNAEFISLSGFLLFVAQKSKDPKIKTYFTDIQKATLRYNLQYMLERKDTYNPVNKLMSLIENAISITEDGMEITSQKGGTSKPLQNKKDSGFQPVTIDDIKESNTEEEKLFSLCSKYLQKQKLGEEELENIILLLPLLDDIIKNRLKIATARDSLKEDHLKEAVNQLRSARDGLIRILEESMSVLPQNQYNVFQRIISSSLSQIEFLMGLISISIDVQKATTALDNAALYAGLAKQPKSMLSYNYLEAVIYVFSGLYEEAVEQYEFTQKIATNYNNDLIITKCRIGQAIALFLSKRENEAMELIDSISEHLKSANLENALIAFLELGDYFYAVGNPKIAISLYNEALECAIDGENLNWRISTILDRMKRAYMNATLESETTSNDTNIDIILDRAHELKNVEKFNEVIGKLSEFNKMFYEDLPKYTEKPIGFFDLDEYLRDVYDIVDILFDDKTGNSVIIGYNKMIGLIGFRIKLEHKISGLHENYTVRLSKKAQVKIIKPSPQLKSKYLIRAIIQIDNTEFLEIDRNIPIFFSQMIG